ncbi:hypothetical protein C8J56DRAFT_931672 [Mycena floridula]|nr:hypothetical protein C8J56DRAFT_931672 [Mycena floridula]
MTNSSTPGGYSPKLTYGIFTAILVLNIVAIIALVWDVSPGIQSILSLYGVKNAGAVALVTTIVATVYTVTVLVCTSIGNAPSPATRIGFDAFAGILYLAASITLGYFMHFMWSSSYGHCNARPWTRQQCQQFWLSVAAVEIIALVFGILSLILTLTDLILTVRVKQRQEQIKKEPQTGGYFAY